MKHANPMRKAFAYFRQWWGPRAAYHLARVRHGADKHERLISQFWLNFESVPIYGEP